MGKSRLDSASAQTGPACSPIGLTLTACDLAPVDRVYLSSSMVNWVMEARRSPASEFSWVAAAAACLEPTAYCRDTSDTCVIAATTWSEADRCCWVAILISFAAVVVSSTIPEIFSNAPTTSRANSAPACTSRDPSSDAKIVAFVSA